MVNNIDIKRKLKNGMLWSVGGTVASKIFVMVASIITSRILGADKNGEFGIINNTVVMFSTFAALGLGITATKFIAEYKDKNKERCEKIIGITNFVATFAALIMSILLFFSSHWLATNTLNNTNIISGLQISAVLLFFNTINTVQISTLSGFEDFKSIAKLSAFQGIISLPIFYTLTLFFGVNGLVFGYGMVAFLSCIFYQIKINQQKKKYNLNVKYNNCFSEYKILLKFSLPSMLTNIMVGPITWVGNTILINTINGYTALGIFNAANQWRSAIMLIPTAISNVILSAMINSEKDNKLNFINMSLSFYVVTAICIPFMIFPELIGILYGSGYAGNTFNVSLVFVALTCCLLAYKEGVARNLVTNNYMWFAFFSNAFWAILFLISMWLLKNYGSVGMSISYFISYFLSTIVFVPFYIKKKIADRSFFYSKKINLLWIILVFDALATLFHIGIIIRVILMIISVSIWLFCINDLFCIKDILKRR